MYSPIKNVDSKTPCPICGHTDWCSYSEDGTTIICRRIEAGSTRTGTDASGAQYYVHLTEVGKNHYQSRIEQERAAAGTIPQASPEFTHEFYANLLSRLSLTSAHREALRARGLTDEEIDRLGYRSWPDEPPWKFVKRMAEKYGREACQSIPGFYYAENQAKRYLTLNYRPGFIIPSLNLDGQIQALITRNDKSDAGAKYLILSSKKRGGFAPSMDCHVPVFSGDHQTIRVTEGILKADIATIRSGILTLGLHGLGWKKSIPTLQRLTPERILLAFDADASKNIHVAQTLKKFIETLRAEFPAATIGLEIWPDTCGKGIDDVLIAGFSTSILDDPARIDDAIADILSKAELAQREQSPNDPDAVIEELNKKHAIVRSGASVLILHEYFNPETNRLESDFIRKADFNTLYENRFVEVKDEGGNKKLKPAAKHWLSSPDRRSYDQIIFAPGIPDDPKYYNLWRGFAFEPVPGDWSLFRAHILENICSGDESLYQYVFAWMADVIQRPADKPGVALVLRGKEGTGKGVFVKTFGALFGRHFTQISQTKHFTGNFNSHLKDCLLLFADEAFWAGDKSGEGVLKAEITEEYRMLEAKGRDPIRVRNLTHYIIASNSDWVVPSGMEARRYCVMDVSEAHMQDHPYFFSIVRQMESGGYAALLYDLLHHDLSSVNLRQIPQTEALLDQKIQSMKSVEKFWLSALQRGTLLEQDECWAEFIQKERLFDEYIKTCAKIGIIHRETDNIFARYLRRLCPRITDARRSITISDETYPPRKVRKMVWVIPTLQTCRDAFSTNIKANLKWPDDADEQEDYCAELRDEREEEPKREGSKDRYLPF